MQTPVKIISFASWLTTALLISIGCVDIEGPIPPPVAEADVFSEFRFSSDAMLIKEGDTLVSNLIATSMAGTAIIVDPAKVIYRSEDSSTVYVDTAGRITARRPSRSPLFVQAGYTHGTTTRWAYINVHITDGEFAATSLKITALDSQRVGYHTAGGKAILPRIRLYLYNGDKRIDNTEIQLPVSVPKPYQAQYTVDSEPGSEPYYTIANGGAGIGKFWVRASINLYGTEVTDSMEFMGIFPVSFGSMVTFAVDGEGKLVFAGASRIVQQPCGLISLTNISPYPVEIVFSDSLSPVDGCSPSIVSDKIRGSINWLPAVLGWKEQISGNMIMPPMTIGIRRSATIGEIDWFVRNPDTGERMPYSGQFSSVHID